MVVLRRQAENDERTAIVALAVRFRVEQLGRVKAAALDPAWAAFVRASAPCRPASQSRVKNVPELSRGLNGRERHETAISSGNGNFL